jgi:hypothetical protein
LPRRRREGHHVVQSAHAAGERTIGYVGIKRLGVGQFYLLSGKDKQGEDLDGAKSERRIVPANAPVQQYRSVTAYNRNTHALIKNVSRASRLSQAADLKKNADGSVDIWFRAETAPR